MTIDDIGTQHRRGDPSVYEFPASFAQQRLWFIDRLMPGNAAYNIHATLPLDAVIDRRILERTLATISARHDTLRTSFIERDGLPVQVVHDAVSVVPAVIDLSGEPDAEQQALALASADAAMPFDLAAAPLMRVSLFVLGPSRHLLSTTVHHIVADAWSMRVFFGELSEVYTALATGRAPNVPDLPIQYCDYAAWQSELLADPDGRDLDHWRTHLDGAEPIQLPFDRQRTNSPSLAGATHRWHVGPSIGRAVRDVARQFRCTPFVVLLAAFQALVHRLGPQDDVVVGVPSAGRDQPELEGLIGFFVNMLPVRVDVSGGPTFVELLTQTRHAVLDAFRHGTVPFDRIVDAVGADRDVSHHPLFQITFQLHETTDPVATPTTSSSAADAPSEVERTTTNFDLAVEMWWVDDRLEGIVTYATELFDATTIEAFTARYNRLLAAAMADTDVFVDRIPLLTDDELEVIVDRWNHTATDYPHDACVHELFEESVRNDPEAVAIVDGSDERILRYVDLDDRAGRVARALAACDVGPGEPVAVVAERSVDLVVALLGVLKCGGAYVGIDPHDPPARIADLVNRAGARVCIVDSVGRTACGDVDGPALIDVDVAERGPTVSNADLAGPTAEDVAYISFTSGSTGEPKGVAVSHRSVARLIRESNVHRFEPGERVLQFSPVAFDASTLEIWGALCNGGTLVVQPAGATSLAELADTIVRNRVDTLWLTAGLFHQMVDEELGAFERVTTVLAGGDVVSATHVRRVLELPGQRTVINGYGPTENTTFTCCHRMTDPITVDENVPIGRPISNTTVYVLDPQRQPVPVGVAGELWAGGDGLACGYIGADEGTEDAFVDGPFPGLPGVDRLYRTGDLVRWRSDGALIFLGRADRQVKVRGFRIEPAEVEAVLLRQPGVRHAIVEAVAGRDGRRLHAFVVRRPAADAAESTGDLAALRHALEAALPSHAVPSVVHDLDEIPLNTNGKVDRAALVAMAESAASTHEYVAPRTEFEETVAALWSDVLERDRIGVYDDFFADLGGHSLLGTRLVARIRDAFDLDLPLRTLFEHPTVAGLALAIEEQLLAEIEQLPAAGTDAGEVGSAREQVVS